MLQVEIPDVARAGSVPGAPGASTGLTCGVALSLHVRHHNRVDIGRRNADGLQVPQEAPDVLGLSDESRIHQYELVAATDHEAVDRKPRRGKAELAEMSALAGGAI